MNAASVAAALGGNVVGRDNILAPGPGHSARDRSLSIRLDAGAPDGFLLFSHSGDDWQLCRDYVRQRLGLPPWEPGDEQDRRAPHRDFDRVAVDHEANTRVRTEDDVIRIARAAALWDEGVDPRGTAADRYLQSRSLNLSDDLAGKVLRFHPSCPWRDEDIGTIRIPVLLAAFRSIDDDLVTAVHRIRVDQPERWPKTERRMLGIVHRAAIKLDPISGSTLTIGEGLETTMAGRQIDRAALAPAWALGSVGSISFFPLLDNVKILKILQETGAPSEDATRLCARRWDRAGRRVRTVKPQVGSDMNDVLMMENSK